MAYIPDHREVIQPHQSSFTVQQGYMPYIIPGMTSCTCTVTKRMKAMKRVRQVNAQKKLSLSFKKKEPIDGRFSQELFAPYC